MMSPCKGCEERSAECHGTCERYAEYRAVHEAEYERRKFASEWIYMHRERVEAVSRTNRRRLQRKGKMRIGGC